jgi:hypothetical protein
MILLHAGAKTNLPWTNTLFSSEFCLCLVNEAVTSVVGKLKLYHPSIKPNPGTVATRLKHGFKEAKDWLAG